eukprot:14751969-Alexandrium_andersonii.AAC.1
MCIRDSTRAAACATTAASCYAASRRHASNAVAAPRCAAAALPLLLSRVPQPLLPATPPHGCMP